MESKADYMPLSNLLCSLQVVLINAVKDVAKALGNLISATKAAAGKPHDDPSMLQLKSSAKVIFKGHHYILLSICFL